MNAATKQVFETWFKPYHDCSWSSVNRADCLAAFELGYKAALAQTEACATPAGGTTTAEDIYAAYPRKVGKQGAIRAIQKAIRDVGIDRLLNDVKTYAEATSRWPAEDRQYIPHPATWFNRGSYEDDPKEWERNTAPASQFSVSH
jgi:hypothetical protein